MTFDRDQLNQAIDTVIAAGVEMTSRSTEEEAWNTARISKEVFDVLAKEGLSRVDAFMVLAITLGVLRDRVDRRFGGESSIN